MRGSGRSYCRRIVAAATVCAIPMAILGCVLGRQEVKSQAVATEASAPQHSADEIVARPAAQMPVKLASLRGGEPVEDRKVFNGRTLRAARTMWMTVTAYSPDARSCGKWADGITASGYSVETNGFKSVAADTRLLPFGTVLSIPGYHNGRLVPVLDRGGAIKGDRLDVLFPTHEEALQWGRQRLLVTVWEYVD